MSKKNVPSASRGHSGLASATSRFTESRDGNLNTRGGGGRVGKSGNTGTPPTPAAGLPLVEAGFAALGGGADAEGLVGVASDEAGRGDLSRGSGVTSPRR